jgi:hypothetical protein
VRVLLRILSCLLGLAVAGAGALLALEVGWAWARPADAPLLVPWPRWRDQLAGLTWRSLPVLAAAGAVVVGGIVLLLLAGMARSRDVMLRDPAPGVSVMTSPRSLARIVGRRVRSEDSVAAASVTATASRVRVRATSEQAADGGLRPRLLDIVGATLTDLPLTRRPKVSVVVDSPKDRP